MGPKPEIHWSLPLCHDANVGGLSGSGALLANFLSDLETHFGWTRSKTHRRKMAATPNQMPGLRLMFAKCIVVISKLPRTSVSEFGCDTSLPTGARALTVLSVSWEASRRARVASARFCGGSLTL